MLPPSHPAGRYRVSRAGVGGRPTRDQTQKRQREAEQGASLLGAFLAAPLKRSRAEDPGSSSSVELPAASAPPPAALSPSSPLGEPAQEAEAREGGGGLGGGGLGGGGLGATLMVG